jgi:hypothetical protein
MRLIFAIAAAAVLLCSAVSAQTVSGTLAGHINDSTGAFIPNVTVTAKSAETNLVREGVTNSEGTMRCPSCRSGPTKCLRRSKDFSPR